MGAETVRVIVQTDAGTEVARYDPVPAPGGHIGNSVWRNLTGRLETPMGWLGRALRDAYEVEQGRDPERLSEKAMRLSAAQETKEE